MSQSTRRVRRWSALLLPLLGALLAACPNASPTPAGAPPELTLHLRSLGFRVVSVVPSGPDQWTGTATGADGAPFTVTASARRGMLHFELKSNVAASAVDALGGTTTSSTGRVLVGSFPYDD